MSKTVISVGNILAGSSLSKRYWSKIELQPAKNKIALSAERWNILLNLKMKTTENDSFFIVFLGIRI